MSNYLFVDTETVDIPQDTSRPINDIDNWPAIRQIAWIICDENREIVERHNYVTGSILPVGDSGVDYCPQVKMSIHKIIPLLMQGLESSVYLIGHNVDYDAKVIAAEMYRLGYDTGSIESLPQICTMRYSVDFCYFAGRVDSRFPKLQELYTKLFHEPFINAHDAYCDVFATFNCFWALVDKDIIRRRDFKELFTQKEYYNSLSTKVTKEDEGNSKRDSYGVLYSTDGRRLISTSAPYYYPTLKGEYSIPNGVEVICDNAFCFRVKELVKIVIPSTVKKIGTNAFAGCSEVRVVCHSAYFGSIIKKPYGHDLYDIVNNRIISFFDYPGGVECPSLALVPEENSNTVQIENTDKRPLMIDSYAFAERNIEHITIGEGVSIKRVSSCHQLVSITLPETMTELPDRFFYDCKKLQSISFPRQLKTIGVASFSRCTSLKKLSLPESVSEIKSLAFQGCEGLEGINFPAAVSQINTDTFSDCRQLKKLVINNNIERIDSNPFVGCSNLTIIGSERFVVQDGALYDDFDKRLISYIRTSECFTVRDGTLSIGDRAFANCKSLFRIELPESITTIGKGAFTGCENLQSINLTERITSIGEAAFYECFNLQSITLPSSVKSIKKRTFYSCKSIEQIIIPYSVTVIEEDAFYKCSSLTDIYVSNPHIRLLGDNPFPYCPLNNIYVPEGMIDKFLWNSSFGIRRKLIREPGITSSLKRWWRNR